MPLTTERLARHLLLPTLMINGLFILLSGADLIDHYFRTFLLPAQIYDVAHHINHDERFESPMWVFLAMIGCLCLGVTIGALSRRTGTGRTVLLLSLFAFWVLGTYIAASYLLPYCPSVPR